MRRAKDPAIVIDGSRPLPTILTPEGQELEVDGLVDFQITYHDLARERIETVYQSELSLGNLFRLQTGLIKARKKPPGTAAPAEWDFLNMYVRLADAGHREILVLVVPKSKSATFDTALDALRLFYALEKYRSVRVCILQTGTTASGVEFLAEMAIKARAAGRPFNEILMEVWNLLPKIEIVIALPTLMYIDASGRATGLTDEGSFPEIMKKRLGRLGKGLTARLTRFIQWSPSVVLSFHQGNEKPITLSLTFDSAVSRLIAEVQKRLRDPDSRVGRLYILQSMAKEEAKRVCQAIGDIYSGDVLEEESEDISAALLSITGPQVVAVFVIRE